MNQNTERPRNTQEIQKAGSSLKKQIAKNTIQLQHICRFLQTVSEWNRTLAQATEILVQNTVHDSERERARAKARRQLAGLRARYDSLTPRERQVMELVVKGLMNKETASKLGTAIITVKIQRASVMKKMKADSMADLVRMAEKLQILGGV